MNEALIQNLQQQLAALQNGIKPQPVQSPQPAQTQDDLDGRIARIVDQRLAEKTQLTGLLDNVLDSEDKAWLQQPVVLSYLPAFFATANGQEAVQILLNEFKAYYENKTRN